MDFASVSIVESVVQGTCPDAILHLGAVSSPVRCHQDRSQAMAINCCCSLADAVKRVNPQCLFLFASTDMVFDGEHAPYPPCHSSKIQSNDAEPVNVYGESKLAFEQYLASSLTHWYALRLSNMLGHPYVYRSAGEKFLQFLYNALSSRTFLGLRADEKRSFVAADDVVTVMLKLLDSFFISVVCDEQAGRVLNVGGPVGLSRLQVAEGLCDELGVKLQLVEPEEMPQPGGDSSTDKMESVSKKSKISADNSDSLITTPPWRVFINPVAATAPATATSGSLRSPRDITMIVDETEALVGFQFRPLRDYVVKCLHVR